MNTTITELTRKQKSNNINVQRRWKIQKGFWIIALSRTKTQAQHVSVEHKFLLKFMLLVQHTYRFSQEPGPARPQEPFWPQVPDLVNIYWVVFNHLHNLYLPWIFPSLSWRAKGAKPDCTLKNKTNKQQQQQHEASEQQTHTAQENIC